MPTANPVSWACIVAVDDVDEDEKLHAIINMLQPNKANNMSLAKVLYIEYSSRYFEIEFD